DWSSDVCSSDLISKSYKFMLKNSINNIFSSKEISGYASYLLISLAYVLIFILFNSFIYTDDFFINNLSKQLTYESVFSFIDLREKYLGVIYIFIFLIILITALYNSVWIDRKIVV